MDNLRWKTLAAGSGAVLALTLVAPADAAGPEPGTFGGIGFDACTAPSSATMQAWLASPYRAVGIYFGGNNRGCTQGNLTAAWVAQQQAAGWHLIPLYVGPQASCTTSTKPNRINNAQAAAQGRATADDAATQAGALGLAADSVLIYDMEAYRTDDAACRAGVLAFISAWTARLHDHGYASGFYSSMGSGVADQVTAYPSPGYARPDYLDFARWDGNVTVSDPDLPAGYWAPHRRIKQYAGGHPETWGGVTIEIDNDFLDVAPLAPARFGDFFGNGWSDVIARTTANGDLNLYPGNGNYLDVGARQRIGTGWSGMSSILRIGDLNRDGHEDVIARRSSTGELFFYPGTALGLTRGRLIGTSWNSMRELTAIGDYTGDGVPDLMAIQSSTNDLYVYPGRAAGTLGVRIKVGSGWGAMGELAGVGDFNLDGRPDFVARRNSDNLLFLYAQRSAGFARRQIGSGWGGMRDLLGAGDFDRDGRTDLVAVRTSDGRVFLYPGRGTGLGVSRQLATGFTGQQPLA